MSISFKLDSFNKIHLFLPASVENSRTQLPTTVIIVENGVISNEKNVEQKKQTKWYVFLWQKNSWIISQH